MLGRSYQKPTLIKRSTIVDQLTMNAPNLEIYIIPDHRSTAQKKSVDLSKFIKFSLKETILALSIFLITTLLGFIFYEIHVNTTNIILLYVLASCFIGIVTYYPIYNLISTFLSIIAINYFFIDPRFTFNMSSSDYPFIFIVMFIVSISISTMAHKLKKENLLASIHAHSMDILLETSQNLQTSNSYQDIMNITCFQLYKMLNRIIIFYPVKNNTLQKPMIYGPHITSDIKREYINHKELAVAQWVLVNNKNAGVSTSTLPAAKGLYLAVRKRTIFLQ